MALNRKSWGWEVLRLILKQIQRKDRSSSTNSSAMDGLFCFRIRKTLLLSALPRYHPAPTFIMPVTCSVRAWLFHDDDWRVCSSALSPNLNLSSRNGVSSWLDWVRIHSIRMRNGLKTLMMFQARRLLSPLSLINPAKSLIFTTWSIIKILRMSTPREWHLPSERSSSSILKKLSAPSFTILLPPAEIRKKFSVSLIRCSWRINTVSSHLLTGRSVPWLTFSNGSLKKMSLSTHRSRMTRRRNCSLDSGLLNHIFDSPLNLKRKLQEYGYHILVGSNKRISFVLIRPNHPCSFYFPSVSEFSYTMVFALTYVITAQSPLLVFKPWISLPARQSCDLSPIRPHPGMIPAQRKHPSVCDPSCHHPPIIGNLQPSPCHRF